MAALTKNKDTLIKAPNHVDHPVAATTKIFAGGMVCVNAANNAVPAADTSGLKFVGIAKDVADNSAGAAGDVDVVCHREGVVFLATGAALTVGDRAYVVDDQTVTTAAVATNDVAVGEVIKVVSGGVWVDLRK